MHISVVCPACREPHRVHEALRGKSIRCQRPSCRRVFVVDDTPEPAPSDSAATTQLRRPRASGSVGDVVPMLPVEEVEPVEEPQPPTAAHVADVLEMLPAESVSEATSLPLEALAPDTAVPAPETARPQTRRTRGAAARTTEVAEAPRPETGRWEEAPPVRRGAGAAGSEALGEVEAVEEEPGAEAAKSKPEPEPHEDEPRPRRRTRVAKWVAAALVVLSLGVLTTGGAIVYKFVYQNEERLAQKADEEYDKGQFRQAAELYEALAKRFAKSEHAERYKYRKEVSELRRRLADPSEDLAEELTHTAQILKEYGNDPLLPPDAGANGVGGDLVRALVGFAERSMKDLKDEQPLKTVEQARPVVKQARLVKPPKGVKPAAYDDAESAFRKLESAVARMLELRKELNELRRVAKNATYGGIVELEQRLKEAGERFPELAGSPEVQQLIKQQRDKHLADVRFVPVKSSQTGTPRDEQEPVLLLDPALQAGTAPGREGVGLVLARGLLCAVSKKTGEVRWTRRVGIDTTTLPVRVPARAGIAERLLVLSSDKPAALTALDLDGNFLWRYELTSPVLGRPLVVDQRAYLPTYDDGIHEIELIEGNLIGRYEIKQRLTVGGTLEEGTRRVYFPADDGCVYVIDVQKRVCERILYTRHPAGSLRSEPIVIPPQGEDGPGFLILNQAAGLDSTRLRVFDLPPAGGDPPETPLKPPATLEGWTWFDPHHDVEKIILLSDAGRMGLFGIRQAHNRDQALFSLLPGGNLNLGPILFPKGDQGPRARGRSEIVQVQNEDLWVLASDRLQRLRVAWSNAAGPRVVPVWPEARELGSPIHASQSLDDLGKASLLTVTRPARRSSVWVSSLDDDKGALHWQRQIGLVCQGEPIPLSVGNAGAPPVWLACDQAGAVFALDPTQLEAVGKSTKLFRIPKVLIATPLDENPDQPPLLLPAEDRQSAFVVATPDNGLELVVRHVKPGGAGGRELEVTEGRVALLQRLRGRPTLVGSQLILPFADGSLARLALPLQPGGGPETGPEWRADRAHPEARCHVVALGGARFLTSDGGRGLNVREWQPGAVTWAELPENRGDGPTLELPDHVTNAVRVPGAAVRVAVTDAAGTLLLLEITDKGGLDVKRSWSLGGQLTAGPFVHTTDKGGARLACVVDRSRLVWIDPAKGVLAWVFETPGQDAIVGEPRLIDDTLVVADAAGRYIGIDAKTGRPLGAGYRLKGSIAPAAGVVPFDKGRLLAPLTDGTQMLLGMEKVTGEKKAAKE